MGQIAASALARYLSAMTETVLLPITRDTSERRQVISALVRDRGSVQVAPLAERFGVSVQTIRKDLRYLSDRGVAERAYGGAILANAVNTAVEPALDAKRVARLADKQRIGRVAASLVMPGASILLDSGTTTLAVAQALTNSELTVLTNDLEVLNALSRNEHMTVVVLGGALRHRNMAFYGPQAVAALDDLRVDTLFLGVDGLDLEAGITTHHEPEALLNRKMLQAARRVVAVTDGSKLGRVCLHRIAGLDRIDDLVIDATAAAELAPAAARFGFVLHPA